MAKYWRDMRSCIRFDYAPFHDCNFCPWHTTKLRDLYRHIKKQHRTFKPTDHR